MHLITVAEATDELGLSASELLTLVMKRRIPRARKVFGWDPEEFERVRSQCANPTRENGEARGALSEAKENKSE